MPRREPASALAKHEQHGQLVKLLREGPLLRHPSRQAPLVAAALRDPRRAAGMRANVSAVELKRQQDELRCIDTLLIGPKKRKGMSNA